MNIFVIGAGSWGTAVANLLSRKGYKVTLWCRRRELRELLIAYRENLPYLPGVRLADSLVFTNNFTSIEDADIVVFGVPTQFLASVLESVRDYTFSGNVIFVSLSKGIEVATNRRVSQIILDTLSVERERVVVLSGPSHAEEVVRLVPTSVVAASFSDDTARIVQNVFSAEYFRVYRSTDVVGVEMGGALKNIIAIASGILEGLEMGDNTKAALITRGLVEITRFGVRFGADPITFSGLSGLGDLLVTCMSKHSRNRFVGYQIGKGKVLNDILAEMRMVAEGVATTEAVYRWSSEIDVSMPITSEVYKVLFEGKPPLDALKELMGRPLKPERFDWNG
ncbi:MAG: NAD(P)-dependent glycerol-3-phosphate dehydrogenase [Synergistetes bacterium]|nr:NAD(P)-dependent glycerol-3-phosphate dehydrogenase [Synergistota bacterium]